MENKSHAIAAGAFVLVVGALLIVLAWWLMRDQGLYKTWELSTRDSIAGLNPQAKVRYKGVSVGQVTYIGFDPHPSKQGHVLIHIEVNQDTPITPTTFATLGYQGVTGLAYVLLDDVGKLTPEKEEQRHSQSANGLPRLPLKTSGLGKLTETAPELLAKIDEATHRINQLLSDDNQKHFSSTLENLNQATLNLVKVAQTADQTILQRVNPALASVPALSQQTQKTLKALQEATQNTHVLISELKKSVQHINDKEGTLAHLETSLDKMTEAAELFTNTTLPIINQSAQNASKATRQIGSNIERIGNHPQSLLFGHQPYLPGPGEAGFQAPDMNK